MPKPLLSQEQITTWLTTLKGWQQKDQSICRTVTTKSFSKGSRIVGLIAPLADEINHHPDVLVTFPRLEISLTTHDSGGITELDFELAGKIDNLLEKEMS